MKIKFPGFPVEEKTYYILTETTSPEHQPYVGMSFIPDRKLEAGGFVDFIAKNGDAAFPLFIKELILSEFSETLEIRNLKGYFIFKKSVF